MEILVVGAGLTGCTFARLLKDQGHGVSIQEKQDKIGGLCQTEMSPNGFLYEPYGARTFHTRRSGVRLFINRFADLMRRAHWKGVILNGQCYPFPISLETVKLLPQAQQICKELGERPAVPDRTNLETCMVSVFGLTLYHLFIYNYTKKMWGEEPRDLAADWAAKRIELRSEDRSLFAGEWQAYPAGGYSRFLQEMIRGIPVRLDSCGFSPGDYDLVIFSGRIDELGKFAHGRLPYRGLRFDYEEDANWENDRFLTINLPQHPKYIRKANFAVAYQREGPHNWVQYQAPAPALDTLPMYPIITREAKTLFANYLAGACAMANVIPAGRLGLFKYLNMDDCIALAIDMVPLVKIWNQLETEQRSSAIEALLGQY